MQKLLDKLGAEFDEGDGWIRIVDADWFADDLRLILSIKYNDESDPELWEIACLGVIEESICSEVTEILAVSSDSSLLKPYLESEVEIMFSENKLSPEFLLGVVCSSCIEIIGRAESIPKFINMIPTVKGVVGSAYGLLGRFPESVATHIITSLIGQPIKAKAMLGHMPKKWNGSGFESHPVLKVLKIGNSFVIAEQFSASRA